LEARTDVVWKTQQGGSVWGRKGKGPPRDKSPQKKRREIRRAGGIRTEGGFWEDELHQGRETLQIKGAAEMKVVDVRQSKNSRGGGSATGGKKSRSYTTLQEKKERR